MTPLKGRRRNTVKELELPGDFCFWLISKDGRSAFLAFKCPCGNVAHDKHDSIPVRQNDVMERPYWKWDGDFNEPTLWPSILRLDVCRWHGYLTKGVWRLDRGDVEP